MSLKKRFLLSSVLMFVVPILLIGILTAAVFAVSMLTHAAEIRALIDIDANIPDHALKPGGQLFLPVFVWLAASVAIIAGTCAAVVFALSRAVLAPLAELKKAAENIRDGNLDFEVLRSELSEVNEVCLAVDDMRQRLKKSVADRLSYEKERNQLIANISHDLRTPITSIKGYVEGMRDGVASTPEMQARYLDTIYSKACAMERLVEHMSDLSELELGRMRFYFEPCGAVGFLRGILDEFRIDMESAGAAFAEKLPEEDNTVRIDRDKIRRVFLNLLGNAVKYRAERPLEITVSARIDAKGITITVKDNGRGIAAGEINRVFEGFYRSDPSRTGARGHGLGLTIARQIVEHHHGKIWIKSEENVGTEVHVFLPAARNGGTS